ncbi:30S ribosomal protein S12 methylthiotransferase RimO [Geotoga petraea]|jgi:ribosomal protein S12 methylthiotransferase|uniref:Ribosomal protein uS12 methylthiotransferase RimO n=1 Tax=Geotoga petraea TaxID=28234 RepID=A0A4Z0VV30_9BACT|nr:30S ribosomal protein S12 methylthiotransferase RimO [Geotoga petraea]TGG87798.1 30S ribosomal protein S12 methylthiotransferase RimO [Geotoga petraea]
MEKFHIVRLGCPKNDADMDIFRGIMENKGYIYSEDPKSADTIFIDTCGFIESAKKESIDTIFDYNSLKEENPDLKIIPIGCLIERYYDDFKEELKEVDGLYGVIPPAVIANNFEKGNYYLQLETPYDTYNCDFRHVPDTNYAYIKIADGCNRNCNFCSIPYFKGKPASREIEDIVNEAKFLVDNGIKEIILVSQDNTLYGADLYRKQSLPELLNKINQIEGDFWVRVMYLHPDFINDEIINAIHNNEKVLNYFDIPVQNGSDNVLKLMGRVRMKDKIKEIVKKAKANGSAVRTTILLGFPGETDQDFKETMDFIDEIEFDRLGVFSFSPEEGTPAFDFDYEVDEGTKDQRVDALLELQKAISEDIMEKYIGKTLDVLVEEYSDGVYIGRSFLDAPEIDGNVFFKTDKKVDLGSFVKIKITNSLDYDLEGELL